MTSRVLVEIKGLTKHYSLRAGFLDFNPNTLHAVERVNLEIFAGETLALVGESGCGKSTMARMILRLIEPTAGTVIFNGVDILSLKGNALLNFHKQVQIIFQDPVGALNPRKSVFQILKDPMLLHKIAENTTLEKSVSEILEKVGLAPASSYLDRNPGEFSGGQRQRIVIARAISVEPKLIVADEPVSALDISIRAQILELMKKLQVERKITFLFITHDLSVVRSIAHRVAVMYLGKIVEISPVAEIFNQPFHPYTQALLLSTPIPNPIEAKKREKVLISGEITSASHAVDGCAFHPRCPFVMDKCRIVNPELIQISENRKVACHLVVQS